MSKGRSILLAGAEPVTAFATFGAMTAIEVLHRENRNRAADIWIAVVRIAPALADSAMILSQMLQRSKNSGRRGGDVIKIYAFQKGAPFLRV
jgi:hypothetical protein